MIIADAAFLSEFSGLPLDQKGDFLFLENHPQIDHFWLVESFDPAFKNRLAGVLPRHRYLSPFGFDDFADKAEQEGYRLVFLDDPAPIFDWIDSLSEPPSVKVASGFPGTINGLLPFQVQAFNFAKDLNAAVLNLSTGTGKTTIACALTEYQFQENLSDLAVWVVKAHNKINTARSIERFIGRSATIIDGDRETRRYGYKSVHMDGKASIVVCNYEAFRFDYDDIENLISDRRVFIVWDELPTKLKSRQTQLYQAVCRALYKTKAGGSYYPSNKIRPSELRQVMLSATPIEHSPEDWFNGIRLLDPSIYGSVRNFNNMFIAHRNLWGEPDRWRNLDLMGAMASPLVYQVDKGSADIRNQFPGVRHDDRAVDLTPTQKALYDEAEIALTSGASGQMNRDEILSAIQVLQFICDMPMAVVDSARRWDAGMGGSKVASKVVAAIGVEAFENAGNAKLDAMADLQVNPSQSQNVAKTVIFTPHAQSIIPYIADSLKVPHVIYHGGLSTAEKQAAQDRFTNDPNCLVFLSSDAGSDSINLECAHTVIHYSLPWSWATLTQRQNRIHRLTSRHAYVTFYTLIAANTVEDRKLTIIRNKKGFHESVLRGEIAHQSDFLRSQSDLLYILGRP